MEDDKYFVFYGPCLSTTFITSCLCLISVYTSVPSHVCVFLHQSGSVNLHVCITACMCGWVLQNEPSFGRRRGQRDVGSVIQLISAAARQIFSSCRPVCSDLLRERLNLSRYLSDVGWQSEANCLTSRFKNKDAVASSASKFCLADVLRWSFA